MKMVWLDDEAVRDPSDRWTVVRTVDEAIELLKVGDVDVISLDHDLGDKRQDPYPVEITGKLVVKWMIENNVFPKFINVHSHNPDESKWMFADLSRFAPKGVMITKFMFANNTSTKLEKLAKVKE